MAAHLVVSSDALTVDLKADVKDDKWVEHSVAL